MLTVVTDSPDEAAEFIRRGGIVAFPTETVYGLGADCFNENAILRVFEAKNRPTDNPLIVHVAELEQIELAAAEVTGSAQKLIERFFPGPLTVVLRKAANVPSVATAGLDTVGVRMPRNAATRAFLTACRTPVVAPSANISGRPSATTWQAVLEDLDGRIDCLLRDDPTEVGIESTVVDCTLDPPILLRAGAIGIAELRETVPVISEHKQTSGDIARSPGMRHIHYAPQARVRIVTPADVVNDVESSGYIGIHDRAEDFAMKRVCDSLDEYAKSLYEFFRECDRNGLANVYCESVEPTGIGSAILDRINRASEK